MSTATQSYSEAETAREALKQETGALNSRLHSGVDVTMETFAGEYLVDGIIEMGGGFKARCFSSDEARSGGIKSALANERTFDLCNDGTWASLLEQAGVGRHPRFRGMEAERLNRQIDDLRIEWNDDYGEYRIYDGDQHLGWVRPRGVSRNNVYGMRFQGETRHLGARRTVRDGIRLLIGYHRAPEGEVLQEEGGNPKIAAREHAPETV